MYIYTYTYAYIYISNPQQKIVPAFCCVPVFAIFFLPYYSLGCDFYVIFAAMKIFIEV